MAPVVNRLIGRLGAGVGLAAEYAQSRKDKQSANFTPSASEAGDVPESSSRRPLPPQQGQPPSYTESVELESDRQLAAGAPAQGDNKVQQDDELHDEDSSEFDDDDSDVTLSDLVDEDEAAWALDEYAASHAPPSYEDATTVVSEDDLVREIIAGQQAHAAQRTKGELPCPVIIPQRRPRNRARGFVRAYAPVLQNVGIDQNTFLRFLTNFHKSTQASPWFTVIEVSSIAAHAAGPAIGFAVEAAVKAATTVGRNIETARKTNNFLDRTNDELFKPAGTLAFLMKYKIDSNMPEDGDGFFGVAAANINLTTNQVVAKYSRDGDSVSGLANQMSMFRIAAGVTEGADDLPESAPLIFPEIDEELARGDPQSLKDKNGEVQAFVQDYLDRRAQIKFSREDPDSALALPQEKLQMKAKLADPDHPMFNSGVVGLLTGGYLNLKSLRTQRQEARQDRRDSRRERRQERREERQARGSDKHQRRVGRHARRSERRRSGEASSSCSLSTPISEKGGKLNVEPEHAGRPHGRGQRRRRRRHQQRKGAIRGTISKVMSEDVVYLMIVNLPSDMELAATVETA